MKRALLMIEDDEQVRHVMRLALKRSEWDFHGAPTGAAGLETAAKAAPSLILLDIELPDMQGFEVCRRLKADAATASIPVIMVSGTRLSPEEKARGLEAGADDFLAKPFNVSELLLRIGNILRVQGA